jgi:4-amino-4-deoxy-L-arabinose transferase-like glycosyltransferase
LEVPRHPSEETSEIGGANPWWRRSVWLAGLITVGALALRLSLADFPTDRHSDEPVVAGLAQRAAETGHFTANWEGSQKGVYWNRATYQFSPYTLVQEGINSALYRWRGWPATLKEHILCARRTSCVWGAFTAFLVFLTVREAFGSPRAAILGEAILALCLLNVQDSIYARVDAFVGLLVVLCFYLAARTMRRPGRGVSAMLAALVAGVAVAAKYNVLPILIVVAWIPLAYRLRHGVSGARAIAIALGALVLVVLGFVLATPELLRDPQPLIEGFRFELDHYQFGHAPYQAYDWRDNNLFYWATYLGLLGFGLLPLLGALLFLAGVVRWPTLEAAVLATFLVVAGGLALLPKVRFERNLEVLLGPLTMAAALGLTAFLSWLKRLGGPTLGPVLAACFLLLVFGQPIRTLIHFREALRPESSPWSSVVVLSAPDRTFMADLKDDPEEKPQALRYRQVFLLDYNDRFSAANFRRWMEFLSPQQIMVVRSKWSEHGYPFSTIDMTHGPARIYIVQRRPAATR